MAKAPKSTKGTSAPPVVSTLPPPEPDKPKRKRALPDDIPRGALPSRLRKTAVKASVAKPDRKAMLAKQAELEAQKVGTPAAAVVGEWNPEAEAAAARETVRAKEAEKVAKRLEAMPHGGALKRSTLDKPDPRTVEPKKSPRRERKVRVPMTEDLFRLICMEMAEEGTPLMQICRRDDRPSKSTFFSYKDGDDLDPDDPGSADVRSARLARYARARADWLAHLVEESVEIADDGTNDWMEREMESGRVDVSLDRDHVQRSKLRIETRLKVAALLDPKRYGNLLKLGDPDAKPMDNGGKSASDIAIGMAKLLAAAQHDATRENVS